MVNFDVFYFCGPYKHYEYDSDSCVSNPEGFFSVEFTHKKSYDRTLESSRLSQIQPLSEDDVIYGSVNTLGTTLFSCKNMTSL